MRDFALSHEEKKALQNKKPVRILVLSEPGNAEAEALATEIMALLPFSVHPDRRRDKRKYRIDGSGPDHIQPMPPGVTLQTPSGNPGANARDVADSILLLLQKNGISARHESYDPSTLHGLPDDESIQILVGSE